MAVSVATAAVPVSVTAVPVAVAAVSVTVAIAAAMVVVVLVALNDVLGGLVGGDVRVLRVDLRVLRGGVLLDDLVNVLDSERRRLVGLPVGAVDDDRSLVLVGDLVLRLVEALELGHVKS
ncbi:hypothetical protein AAT19DRAFT_16118 [Rhodotorula toruloides]|uniref:Uncharacterized protein n=1 Tax=Rhodotorula toruloides TaxID=5286 RepID=A0A2T0A5T5_RHOTO|nr:hypothetical protein AAT19DRAFT_16118 [Rhodotorula toruloides]